MASIDKRLNGKWRARYREVPGGPQKTRSFDRKLDAVAFLDVVRGDLARGTYVDPGAGRTFRRFAEPWLASQTFDPSTHEAVALRLRVHLLPTLGDMDLRAIRPSTVQAWVRGRQQQLAPTYVRVLLANLSAILGAATDDGLIASNPCRARSVKAPALERERVEPWPQERVAAVVAAHPMAYRAMPVAAAGAGLRQGEVFGLRVEDVDFLGRRLRIRQQVKLLDGKPVTAPPKGGKTREVPLADVVAVALAERLRQHPAGSAGLVFTSREGKPMNRNYYNTRVWKPALRKAGVEPLRTNGMHALRHYYASVLLDAGENVRALADYLGHADPGFTLRVYTHLMPASEDRARRAVEEALGPRAEDWLRTAEPAGG
ncbi:site-specific integrase [soil metagenome]